MGDFATIQQHERLEETVQEVVNTVSKLSEAQAATTASIDNLTGLIKAETGNRQNQDYRTEQTLKELTSEIKTKKSGISSKEMLTAVVVAIGALGTIVAIIAAIGTLGVWIATIISTNVAANLDDTLQDDIESLRAKSQIAEVEYGRVQKYIDYFRDEEHRNDKQDVRISNLERESNDALRN